LQHISIARWKVIQLYEIAMAARTCDSLQQAQNKEITQYRSIVMHADSVVAIHEKLLSVGDAIHRQDSVLLRLSQDEIEMVKKEKRKWRNGAIGASIIVVLLLLAQGGF